MKVSKLIHDLHEKVEKLEEDNNLLKETCKRVKKDNIDLRRNQDQDNLNRELSSAKIGNVLHERTIKDLKMENESYKRQNVELRSKLKEAEEFNVGNINTDTYHRVTTIDDNMKRLAYLEKLLEAKNYVFSEIPNTPENLKMLKLLKKHVNKDMYRVRWRGQYLVDGEDWRKYVDGQPLSKSKCIRVYIDNLSAYGSTEGFNLDEIRTILDGLHKVKEQSEEFIRSFDIDGEDNEDVNDEKLSLQKTEVLEDYFEEMKFHIEECQQKMSEVE